MVAVAGEDKTRSSTLYPFIYPLLHRNMLIRPRQTARMYLTLCHGNILPNAIQNLTHHAAEARQSILSQILEPEAADRLGRIRLVKESRAQDVENRLIMLARSGQLRSKVTETQLKELLGAVAENNEEEKIVVSRRKGGWDDDDDDLFADL